MEQTTKKISDKIVLVWITLLSVGASFFVYSNNLLLMYNDSRSHLNIARRVIDNLTPGIAQFGGTWLPLYHILLLPFVWNDFLFHSGLAGNIISALAYIGASYYLYKISSLLTKSPVAILTALVIFSLNPNLLYMQATPMTETLLLFSVNASLYYLLVWSRKQELVYIITAAFFIFLGTLVRYDAWFVVIFEAFFIFFVTLKNKDYKIAEGNYVTFLTLSSLGIILWFLWNLLIWKNPLYFLLGEFSARAQQKELFESAGNLTTKYNIVQSTLVFLSAMYENIGTLFVLTGFVGAILMFIRKENIVSKMYSIVLVSPIIFNIISLFGGISVIFTKAYPDTDIHSIFNVRYGLMGLTAIAIFSGYLADFIVGKLRFFYISLILIATYVFIQMFIFYQLTIPVVIEDTMIGKSGFKTIQEETATAIRNNYTDGLILMSAGASDDPIMYTTHLPLNVFIHEGTGKYWKTSLTRPEIYATFIVACQGDSISKEIQKKPKLIKNYEEIYKNSECQLFRIKNK